MYMKFICIPVEALIFFRLHPSNYLNWKTYCDDHSSHSKQQALNKDLSLEMSVLARASAQSLNMLYVSTHLRVPRGGNI